MLIIRDEYFDYFYKNNKLKRKKSEIFSDSSEFENESDLFDSEISEKLQEENDLLNLNL
jgi:phosphoenolpyruvate synthase/pyruvate phosphate dikinase